MEALSCAGRNYLPLISSAFGLLSARAGLRFASMAEFAAH